MPVRHKKEAFIKMLPLYPLLEDSVIMAPMESTGRPHSGDDTTLRIERTQTQLLRFRLTQQDKSKKQWRIINLNQRIGRPSSPLSLRATTAAKLFRHPSNHKKGQLKAALFDFRQAYQRRYTAVISSRLPLPMLCRYQPVNARF